MTKAKTFSMFQVGAILLFLIVLPIILVLLLIVPQDLAWQQESKSLIASKLKLSFGLNDPQKHLDAYAVQLGELQARIMRLDAQSERLAKLAGEKKLNPNKPASDTSFSNEVSGEIKMGGRGGPLVLSAPITEQDLQQKIAEAMTKIDFNADYLSDIEAKLLQQSVLKDMLPNGDPIHVAFNSSSYGWRTDPFTGRKAFHEGLDFSADTGTPIYAAAGGIVTSAERTPDYGNIVKIYHGSGLETRYAHTLKIMVKTGDHVEKGQLIALVGSTGRSTGSHLHYEIRLNDNPLDPRRYLKASN